MLASAIMSKTVVGRGSVCDYPLEVVYARGARSVLCVNGVHAACSIGRRQTVDALTGSWIDQTSTGRWLAFAVLCSTAVELFCRPLNPSLGLLRTQSRSLQAASSAHNV